MSLIPRSRGGMLWRFALGSVLIIAAVAATTAVAGLLQFKQFAQELGFNRAIKTSQITVADAGNPQTLLLIGSDHRAGEPFSASNTDTMLLVRIDPSSSTINLLSLPRDLKVDVPGHGTRKLNAAYSLGGPDLLLRTIHANIFPGLHVNHIIDINFRGFSGLIDAIGCVYSDVDHRYYNNTLYTHYSSIDIQPGYQKLCGDNQSQSGALAFVRFRHTDSDLVRNARQQDFLRWAKDGYGEGDLIANRDKLLTIFGQNTQTDADLHSADGVENLFTLIAFSAGHVIKSVPFPAITPPCLPNLPCYVMADQRLLGQRFAEFMHASKSVPHPASGGGAPPKGHPGPAPPAAVMADPSDGIAQATALGRHVGLPVVFPARIVAGSRYCTNATCTIGPVANSYPRAYLIHGRGGGSFPSYRMTLVINPVLGQYYGIQGTTWRNPPILNHPTQVRTVAGKQLELFVNGGKLSLVAWKAPRGVYWVSNTLTDAIPNNAMVAMAASFTVGP